MARVWLWFPCAPWTMLNTQRPIALSYKCLPLNSTLKICFVLFKPSCAPRSANISVVLTPTIATNLLLAISGISAAVIKLHFAGTYRDSCFPVPPWRLCSCLPTQNSEKGGIGWMPPDSWRFSFIILSAHEVHCNHHQEKRSWANAEGFGRAGLGRAEGQPIPKLLQLTTSSSFLGRSQ